MSPPRWSYSKSTFFSTIFFLNKTCLIFVRGRIDLWPNFFSVYARKLRRLGEESPAPSFDAHPSKCVFGEFLPLIALVKIELSGRTKKERVKERNRGRAAGISSLSTPRIMAPEYIPRGRNAAAGFMATQLAARLQRKCEWKVAFCRAERLVKF